MLTDDAVRAELERIDPDYSYTWDIHTKDLKCDGCPVEKALRLLAESLQALREIAGGKWTESGDLVGASWSELKAIKIASNAAKEKS